jgi:hypothetical protein
MNNMKLQHPKPLLWRHFSMSLGRLSVGTQYEARVQLLSRQNRTDVDENDSRGSGSGPGSSDSSVEIFRATTSLTVPALCTELEQHQPFKLIWTFPSYDHLNANVIDIQSISLDWQKVCHGVKESFPLRSVSRLSLSMPNNHHCIPFASEFFQNISFPNVEILELSDNFSPGSLYDTTLQVIATTLPQVQVLALRNTAVRHSPMVSSAFCIALADLIRSSSCLRDFYLVGIQFPSEKDWVIVREALRNSTSIQNASLSQLGIAAVAIADASIDHTTTKYNDEYFTQQVEAGSRFMERRACTQFLLNVMNIPEPHTMQQKLQALLHVRGHYRSMRTTVSNGTPSRIDDGHEYKIAPMIERLASIGDCVDFGYEFLRQFVDPSIWARPMSDCSI